MRNYIYIKIIFTMLLVLIVGCESEDELEKGTCKIKVSGYLNKSITGQAIYDNVPAGGGQTLFFLELKDVVEPGVNYRYVEFQGGKKPNVGTHSLINTEDNDTIEGIIVGHYGDSDVPEGFHSTGGSIVISYSEDNLLKGWSEFTAASFISLGGGKSTKAEIKIFVEFYAEEGNVGIILN